MRTTIDIDAPILRDLKRMQKKEGLTLGRLVSQLLGAALSARRGTPAPARPGLRWKARAMGQKLDVEDRHALAAALDLEDRPR